MTKTLSFLGRHAVTLLIILGMVAYVLVAGVTKSCPSCAAVTGLMGLNGKEFVPTSLEDGKVQRAVQTISDEHPYE